MRRNHLSGLVTTTLAWALAACAGNDAEPLKARASALETLDTPPPEGADAGSTYETSEPPPPEGADAGSTYETSEPPLPEGADAGSTYETSEPPENNCPASTTCAPAPEIYVCRFNCCTSVVNRIEANIVGQFTAPGDPAELVETLAEGMRAWCDKNPIPSLKPCAPAYGRFVPIVPTPAPGSLEIAVGNVCRPR